MKARVAPGFAFVVTSLPAAAVATYVRPLLGISFLITAAAALASNGMRRALASMNVRPADSDDPVSPAAIARTLHKMERGHTIFLATMSVVYAVVALGSHDASVRLFAIAFAVAAAAAGPLTSVRPRYGLWVAASALGGALIVWSVGVGHV
jgi:hypothetical protein